MSSEIITKLEAFQSGFETKFNDLQRQIDAIDARGSLILPGTKSAGSPGADIAAAIIEHKAQFDSAARVRFEVPSTMLGTKTVVTTSGLVSPVADSRFGLAEGTTYGAIRALFPAIALDDNSVYQIRETATTGWAASPQTEASDKAESAASLSAISVSVRTLAHWIPVSKQALADVGGLAAFLDRRLMWGLSRLADQEILSGDNTGEHLSGLIYSAASFDPTLLGSGVWDYYSVINAAMTQLKTSGFSASFLIMHPRDGFRMRNKRDTTYQFIQPIPGLMPPAIVESPLCTEGTFVVGDASQALIRVRQAATIDVSESHSDYFTKNMVAVRAEERALLQVLSPNAFVTGSFSTSPA